MVRYNNYCLLDVPIFVLQLLVVELLRSDLWRLARCLLPLLLLALQAHLAHQYRPRLLPHLRL